MQLTERDWTVWVGGHRCRQFPRICLLVVLSFTFSHFSVVVSGQKGIFLAAVPTLGFQSSQQHLKTTAHHRCCDRKAAPPHPHVCVSTQRARMGKYMLSWPRPHSFSGAAHAPGGAALSFPAARHPHQFLPVVETW